MISNIQNLPSTEQRNQAYTGGDIDDFSRLMYNYRNDMSIGFTVLNVDWIYRNYKKRTFAIFEIKTGRGVLSTAQKVTFSELGNMLKIGAKSENWTFYGVAVLTFERTCFHNGKAWLNDKEITEQQFKKMLKTYF